MKKVLLAVAVMVSAAASFAAAQAKSIDTYWTAAGKSYAAAGQFQKPAPWAPGQYVVVGHSVNGKHDSVSTTLLVRQEQGGWVIEVSAINAKGQETATQMLLTGYDQAMAIGDGSKVEMLWMKTRDKNGKVSTIEGPALGMFKTLSKSTYQNIASSVSTFNDGGSVEVPAGSFAGTNMIKAKATVMGRTIESESWMHPAVPVNGMVKSRTTDGKSLIELLSFGFDGKPVLQ